MRVGSADSWLLIVPIVLVAATLVVALSAMGIFPPVSDLLNTVTNFLSTVLLRRPA